MANVRLAHDIAALFRRDLTRLLQELQAFDVDETALWKTLPGVTNTAGHLILHIEGNLREFIGRKMGGCPYTRHRDEEFNGPAIAFVNLVSRVEDLRAVIPAVVSELESASLETSYEEALQYLVHLHGHLNYHLGQIDYLRRVLLRANAIDFVTV